MALMASVAAESPPGSGLPYSIDITCPIALPSKGPNVSWPILTTTAFSARRRYLDSLFLPEILSPLSHLIQDLLRSPSSATEVSPLLLSLSEIENRHRKVLAPLITALTAHGSPESRWAKLEEAKLASKIEGDELDVVVAAVALRLGCRRVVEGETVLSKKLIEELERRETLIQIILLLVYISHAQPPKKRKRDRRDAEPVISPRDQPKEALELLFDRLSVWQAVAELGMGNDGMGEMLQNFWSTVILKYSPEFCRSFHSKVFGKPYDEPSTTKKPRKPKLTRARPSSDKPETLRPAPPAPRHSIPPEENTLMRRSVSHTSDKERPRSRSASIDRTNSNFQLPPKKALIRAPSGKDLFKGREVGLMRRSASAIMRRDRPEIQPPPPGAPSLARSGLLGRKISDKSRPAEQASTSTSSNTLVFATPSKPKNGNMFGKYIQPTPIQEESPWRQSWVGETPHSHGRVSHVAETPYSHGRVSRVEDTPAKSRVGETPVGKSEMADWEEDPLGDLMVMTDEEDERGLVPETPAR